MPANRKLALKFAFLGLLAFLLLPAAAQANPVSKFPDPLCGGPNCICPGGPGSNFCILQLRINNPKHVHFKPLGDWEFINVLGQGIKQFEARPGQTVYVNRSANGPTSFGVQFCKRTLTGGTNCSPWTTVTLQEPTVADLEECENYAARAVQAAKDNVTFKCGYVGGRWANDYKAHYNACAFAPGSPPILAETKARTADLQTCKNKGSANSAQPAEPAKPAPWTPPPLPVGSLIGVWDTKMSDGNNYTLNIMPSGDALNASIGAVNASLDGTLQFSFFQDNKRMNFVLTQPKIGAVSRGAIQVTDDDHFTGSLTTDGSGAQRNWTGTRRK